MELRRSQPLASAAIAAGIAVVFTMVIVLLAGLHKASVESRQGSVYGHMAAAYRDARTGLAQEEAAERGYVLRHDADDLAAHAAAARVVLAALRRVPYADASEPLRDHGAYVTAAHDMFAAARHGDDEKVEQIDDNLGNPAFEAIERELAQRATAASHRAVALGTSARAEQQAIMRTGTLVAILAFAIFAALGLTVRRSRRRLDAARAAELARLSEMASTDPLTGLRNHRCFHEDLARELQRVARQDVPLTLVLIDLDDLKTLNDDHGHQAGDERLRALADAIRLTSRGTDCAYRIGGDEFAVLLPDCRAWGGLEYAQRLRSALPGFTATAGVGEALSLRSRDELFREADLALLAAKRLDQDAAIFTPEMHAVAAADADEHHTRMLSTALARAVDAKDSYTRSHCQTVSQLTALIGSELELGEERIGRLRLAGLLHDVGKIGIPDAILNKPAKLTGEEFAQMQRHSLLGSEIVGAAGLPEEARWVRHHHERIDGRGYPDGLCGEEIPLESRIILVADAYEAMTSDRPYRKAPGREFAIAELRRGAGTQFDPAAVEALCRALATVDLEVSAI